MSDPITAPALSATGTLLCQVDTLVQHAHALFGFGWALDRAGLIVRASLHLHFADGSEQTVLVAIARAREDVAVAFPTSPQAARAGFMFMAGWREQAPVSAELVFDMADGSMQRKALDLAAPNSPANGVTQAGGRRYLLRRALAHLRQGKLLALLHKALRRVRARARPANRSGRQLAALLNGQPCRLVIDHVMGGGANLFRERLVTQWLAAGDTVVLLSFRLASLQPFIEVRSGKGSLVVTLQQLDELSTILEAASLRELFFNCAVSFPKAEAVQRLLLALKQRFEVPMVVAMHEYFLVCPSAFLLDRKGQFCGVPALEHCQRCLPSHSDGFASLTGERSIERWRQMWGEVLLAADEVRCFSESTRRLLARAYPFMAGRMTLRPHAVDPLRPVRLARNPQATLRVAVIGMISPHKGAQVVVDLAKAIVDSGANIHLVVMGNLDAADVPEVVEQTGPYERHNLPDLLEQQRIDMALLPSICPETFSFVAHEIVAMQVPLLCLNLGAQADLTRSIRAGWVAMRQDGPGLLAELLAFDRHLHPLRLKVLA